MTVLSTMPIQNSLKNIFFALFLQGEVVDRIEYNVEHTQMKVEAGVAELRQAERYQRKNWKMKCILVLAVVVIILLFVLMVKIS